MSRSAYQAKLFDKQITLPNGFIYRPDFLTITEERTLLSYIEDLPLEHAVGAGIYQGKRRYLNFGWSYSFKEGKLIEGPPLPFWLAPVAHKIAKWMDIPKAKVVEALVQEYPVGSGIGWHRDNEPFEYVIGISLGAWSRMRLRPMRSHQKRKRSVQDVVALELEPRSAYIMQRESRWLYQHSVAPVRALRYSITFRTLL